jgi:hypothetical protein
MSSPSPPTRLYGDRATGVAPMSPLVCCPSRSHHPRALRHQWPPVANPQHLAPCTSELYAGLSLTGALHLSRPSCIAPTKSLLSLWDPDGRRRGSPRRIYAWSKPRARSGERTVRSPLSSPACTLRSARSRCQALTSLCVERRGTNELN